MFERLAGQLLSTVLSKYFTEESLARNKSSTSAQLGVWSGYISLENLELKKDVINTLLKRKGLPFEIVHCSFRRVEITVPWAKLTSPTAALNGNKEDAVVVIVVDGIHLLARTNFTFDDIALREGKILQRRQALEQAGSFEKNPIGASGSSSMSYTEMIKKRIKDGLLREILDKLHIHVRDVHIRLEDIESDPENPFACGVTMESMHVQHDEHGTAFSTSVNSEGEVSANETVSAEKVIHKVARLNHFAIYWNPLQHDAGVPVENSILQYAFADSPDRISRALDLCIDRRASVMASPSRNPYTPHHTYLLLPVDGTLNGFLSTDPSNLDEHPALGAVINMDELSVQIRDFQCIQILGFVNAVKNHNFIKKHRIYRPLVPVKDNPRLWWQYTTRVVRYQLKENRLRWSWSRFEQRYRLRGRYMGLYERKMRFRSKEQTGHIARIASDGDILEGSRHAIEGTQIIPKENGVSAVNGSSAGATAAADDGAGPSVPNGSEDVGRLGQMELNELQGLEDGIRGDLSISDIVLFRAVVNTRLGKSSANGHATETGSSWWRRTVQGVAIDDAEAKEEFERLLAYLEKSSEDSCILEAGRAQRAISITFRLERAGVAFFSPLRSTSDQTQLRRLHERFLELAITGLQLDLSVMDDYESSRLRMSILDFVGTEIRADRSLRIIVQKAFKAISTDELRAESGTENDSAQDPLVELSITSNSPKSQGCDLRLHCFVNKITIFLVPDCQWIARLKQLLRDLASVPSAEDFWDDIAMVSLNSFASGRLGLLAAAGFEHKNMDLDICFLCPVLRVGDGRGNSLVIDLGTALLKTEKLAGVATTELGDQTLVGYTTKLGERAPSTPPRGSMEQGWTTESCSTPTRASRSNRNSPRKVAENFFYQSSGMSVDSRNYPGRSTKSRRGSLPLDEPLAFPAIGANDTADIQAFFYDVYQLHLETGKITLEIGEDSSRDVTGGLEVVTSIQKSVIPADFSLCRLKAHSVVSDFSIVLSESVVARLGVLVETWKSVFAGDALSQSGPVVQESSALRGRLSMMAPLLPSSPAVLDTFDEESPANSQVDENEFFDAVDGYDGSSAAENSGLGFDGSWILDAESVIDADSRSLPPDRRGRRRQRSLSDVSSVSDQSTKGRRGQQENAYLSADNLARLEEGAGEDESVMENIVEGDNDSFHSAISTGGQIDLAKELEEDIQRSEDKIKQLKDKMMEVTKATVKSALLPKLAETKLRRTERKSIKLALDKSTAELSALRALQCDLQSQISGARVDEQKELDAVSQGNDYNRHSKNGEPKRVSIVGGQNQSANRARVLLNARKKRESLSGINDVHHILTRTINRKLFEVSILFNQLKVEIHLDDARTDESSPSAESSKFEVSAAGIGLVLFHCVDDTKGFFSIEHVSVALKDVNAHGRPLFLFIGGTNDALSDIQLPSHFPQHIASSMEERFLRMGFHQRRRLADGSTSSTETAKMRLVFGDIELTPHQQCLDPLILLWSNVRENLSATTADVSASGRAGAGKGIHEGGSSGTDLANEMSDPTRYYDLSIRFASVRVALSLENKIIGACTMAEVSARCVHVSSHCTFKSRSQLDLRCINFQVLDVVDLEAGRGTEILGRSDPYVHLFHLQLRRQLVPEDETSGWVVGLGKERPEESRVPPGRRVWNIHVGVKMNPIGTMASPRAISRITDSLNEVGSVISTRRVSTTAIYEDPVSEASQLEKTPESIPIRWRVDLSVARASVIFPNQRSGDWIISDDIGNRLVTTCSLLASVQESGRRRESISLRAGLVDLSVVRSDDWPILEPFTVVSEVCMDLKDGSNRTVDKSPLIMPSDSPWNEIAALMHRHGWDAMPERVDEDMNVSFDVKITPIKMNFSSPLCRLLLGTARSFGEIRPEKSDDAIESVRGDSRTATPKIGLRISLPEMDVKLLREVDNKQISSADSLVSFTMQDVILAYDQGPAVTGSVFIGNSSLYDLSCRPGVRAVGIDPIEHGADSTENPSFVKIKFHLSRCLDGPRTMRLDVNWGRIQCLVLPSLLRSLITFQQDVKSMLVTPSTLEKTKRNGDDDNIFTKILEKMGDVIFILSASAESFECILSSKDIIAYIREQSLGPIGVVTFRWKATLNVTLALDTLRGTSIPWLALNPDGEFTDSPDAHLFKEFSARYLDQSSGFLAGADEVGHKLINAFTSKVNLQVGGFQALRTNIASTPMNASNFANSSYQPNPRIHFCVDSPLAGERRITNPIDFDLTYRLTGASTSRVDENGIDSRLEVSQILHLKAKFVDVLVYISQSAGGATEAFRVTLKPIVDMLKRKEDREQPRRIESEKDDKRPENFAAVFGRASTLCSIHAEGFQVTCVPGGATALTESPIIKFELSQFSLGLAVVPVQKDVKFMTETNVNKDGHSEPLVSGVDVMHLTAAGWVSCEVSADYHNRRLVAWEPFIEPWVADLRFGIDLVEVLRISPSIKKDLPSWNSPSESVLSPVDVFQSGSINEMAGETLRDIGRLLRSPFKATSTKPAHNGYIPSHLISHPDICYLMLASAARSTMVSVLYPPTASTPEARDLVFSSLPGRSPEEFLSSFGFPQTHGQDGRNPMPYHSMSFVISDVQPLNVNLTGALIENILSFVDNAKREEFAPHWIRNDSGMVSAMLLLLKSCFYLAKCVFQLRFRPFVSKRFSTSIGPNKGKEQPRQLCQMGLRCL
jgi:hypothetical protein